MSEYQRPDFLYIQGAPRSGTTYLYDLINTSRAIMLLSEFPIFQFLRGDPVDSAVLAIASKIEASLGNSMMKDVKNLNTVITAFLNGKRDENGIAIGHRARRVLNMINVIGPKYQISALGPEKSDPLRTLKLDILFLLAARVTGLDALSAEQIKHFGVKLPGVFDPSNVQLLGKLSNRLRIVSVFRNPYNVILSSMQRLLNTKTGFDNWHITSVQDAVIEWTRNFYFCQQCMRIVGPENYLPLIYERFVGPKNRVALCKFLDVDDLRPLAFEDLEATKAIAENSFGDEVKQFISRSGLPTEGEWDTFVDDSSATKGIFELKPVLLHDLDILDFSTAGCPVVKTGFDRVEQDGMWLIEPEGSIRFFVPERMRTGTVQIDLSWPPGKNGGIWVRLNGSDETSIAANHQGPVPGDATDSSVSPSRITLPGPTRAWNLLEIRVENLVTVEKDPRKLGVKLQRMTLLPV